MEAAQPVRLRRPEAAPPGGDAQEGPEPAGESPGAAEEEPRPLTPPREAAQGRAEGRGPGRVKEAGPRAEQAGRRWPVGRGCPPCAPRSLLKVVAALAALAGIGALAV